MNNHWYILKVVSGQERKLSEQLNQQIGIGKIKNVIRFVCPIENEMVTTKKKKILRQKVIYNGYLYFETNHVLNEDELKEFDNYPSIISMFGEKKPILMKSYDVNRILKDEILEEHNDKKVNKFNIGESVLIVDGVFKGFYGEVHVLNEMNVELFVSIFGKKTPVVLTYNQFKKQ